MKALLPIICLLAVGCSYVPPSENKVDWYATLESGGPTKLTPVSKVPGEICLQICTKYREPLLGVDGPGGPREMIEYWANLAGVGPVYRDPEFFPNSGGLHWNSHHRGTITIDRKEMKVIVDLQRIVSKPGEAEILEPSQANGVYPLKRWTK